MRLSVLCRPPPRSLLWGLCKGIKRQVGAPPGQLPGPVMPLLVKVHNPKPLVPCRPLLHAILHSRVSATFGIEVDAVKCQKACPFVRHCVAEMAGHGVELAAGSLPKFICAPIEQVRGA